MKNGRSKLWWAFWGGVFLIVSALSWASITVYTLEARSAESRAMNQRQELIRLALWRMDSRLAPMIALEAARPIEDYENVLDLNPPAPLGDRVETAAEQQKKAFVGGDYAQGFFEIDELGSTKGSGSEADAIAMLTNTQQQVLDGGLIAQEVESESLMVMDEQEEGLASSNALALRRSSLSIPAKSEADFEARQQIANIAQNSQALSASPALEEIVDATSVSTGFISGAAAGDSRTPIIDDRKADSKEKFESADIDQKVNQKDMDDSGRFDDDSRAKDREANAIEDVVGAIEPRWVLRDDGTHELILTRTIQRGGHPVVQGVWLDWASMSSELLGSIRDLLPTSTLIPITSDRALSPRGKGGKSRQQLPAYRLATVPVSFIPGGAVDVSGDRLTPAMMAMLVTWIAVILAMIAVGIVLRTVLTLSARRAHFVGAVTHELRTPLTTFRLYSQMLADGMVTDESVRKEYLTTLKRESDRLTGIVENVLEYARISRQRYGKDKPKGEQRISVGELIARIVPPMSRLGEQSGMDLVVSDETGDHAQRTVTLDPHAIERIVMNLMDNACKYAGGDHELGDDRDLRVHLDASVDGNSLLLVVADHGPGVASRDRRKIFGEFVRGSSSALRDRSGLGLGLALSRGLAVEMGGDLSLIRKRGHGAEFELRIPLNDEVLS